MPDRVVPLFVRDADDEAEGQVVLSELPRRPVERDEAEGAVLEGAGAVQQGEGGEDVNNERTEYIHRHPRTSTHFKPYNITFYTPDLP